MDKTSEQLKKEIKEKQAELEKLEKEEANKKRQLAVKDLSEYTSEEKIKAFDKLYASAAFNLHEREDNGRLGDKDDDEEHYSWESLMELLARNKTKFWDYYNSL